MLTATLGATRSSGSPRRWDRSITREAPIAAVTVAAADPSRRPRHQASPDSSSSPSCASSWPRGRRRAGRSDPTTVRRLRPRAAAAAAQARRSSAAPYVPRRPGRPPPRFAGHRAPARRAPAVIVQPARGRHAGAADRSDGRLVQLHHRASVWPAPLEVGHERPHHHGIGGQHVGDRTPVRQDPMAVAQLHLRAEGPRPGDGDLDRVGAHIALRGGIAVLTEPRTRPAHHPRARVGGAPARRHPWVVVSPAKSGATRASSARRARSCPRPAPGRAVPAHSAGRGSRRS